MFLSPRLAGLAALCGAAMLALTGCTGSGSSTHPDASAGSSSTAPATGSASPTATHPTAQPTPTGPRRGSGAPVHVSLYQGDGQTYGVAMPIIAYLSAPITDASVFDRVTSVTVNGVPAAPVSP